MKAVYHEDKKAITEWLSRRSTNLGKRIKSNNPPLLGNGDWQCEDEPSDEARQSCTRATLDDATMPSVVENEEEDEDAYLGFNELPEDPHDEGPSDPVPDARQVPALPVKKRKVRHLHCHSHH